VGDVVELEDRLLVIGSRRGPVIGTNLLIWILLALLAIAIWRRRGARVGVELLALAAAYLPLVLLLSGALTPSEPAERLLVGLGAPALAVATRLLLPGCRGLAVAALATVCAYAVDVVVGSPLTTLSLIGPNPALGARFFGIGNELEATLAVLLLIGVGAALAAWRPGEDRGAALAFAATALLAVAVFAPGSFGADVGAAVVFPAGAAVAAAVALRARRRGLLILLAAPLLAVAALLALELALGGDAHLSRSVLEAGGLDEVGEVIERRLRLSANSFANQAGAPYLWIAVALVVLAIAQRRRVLGWFSDRRLLLAGFAGAAGATAVGTVANDSGALLLMIGMAYLTLTAGFAWARRDGHEDRA
jgi:hypothetical protein